MVSKTVEESELWHLRYGHLNIKGLQLLKSKEMVHNLPTIISSTHVCEGCVLGKQTKRSFPMGKAKRASDVLELVHADSCGPMKEESLTGSKYFFLLTDDYTRMSWVYFLQAKSEAFEYFKKFKAMVEKQSGNYLKIFRTDRGGEFTSIEFTDFCGEQGIKRELTAPYTPEQNGAAERKNRTVVEMARSMLKFMGLPDCYWAEGVATAVYILNLSPTKDVWNQTPYEAWYGNTHSVSHLRVFGCICYALQTTGKHKLVDKSKKFIFVGYCSQSKAYRLYDPISETVVVSRNVVFDELAKWEWEKDVNKRNTYFEEDGCASSQEMEEQKLNSSNNSNRSTPEKSSVSEVLKHSSVN